MTLSWDNLVFAFSLSLLAGLSTGIGSLLSLLTKRTNTKFLAVMLGFSAGVMLYVSFVEIFSQSREVLTGVYGVTKGTWVTVIAFFTGIFVIGLIDKLIPDSENPHEIHTIEEMDTEKPEQHLVEKQNKSLMRMGLFTGVQLRFITSQKVWLR